MLTPFRNEALTDFTLPENRAAFEKAMVKVKAELGRELPAVINGQEIWNGEGFVSINPARPAEVVARFPKLGIEHAEQAIKAAAEAFKTWQYVPVQERAGYILHAAGEMRRRKQEFNAVMVLEVGKSWAEADADTSESIDFLDIVFRLEKAFNIKIPRGEMFPEDIFNNPDCVKDGKVTAQGLQVMKERMPHVDLSKLVPGDDIEKMQFTVDTVVNYIEKKVKG